MDIVFISSGIYGLSRVFYEEFKWVIKLKC
jgi:hypothetical protein